VAIVRELLVRIGFVTDKKAINATNSAITGFRTRFALAATAATFAISKITGFFNGVAQATLDSDDLAKALGLSLKQFGQLSAGLKTFRLDDSQIATTLKTVNKLFVDFRTGANNELAQIADAFNFKIDRNAGPTVVFKQILEGISKIENEQERIRVAANIFGDALAPRISEMSQNIGLLTENVIKFENAGNNLENSLENVKNYTAAVTQLSTAFNQFAQSLAIVAFPVLTKLVQYLESLTNFYSGIFSGDKNLLKKGLEQGSALLDPAFNATGLNQVADFFKDLGKQTGTINTADDYQRYLNGEAGYEVNPYLNPFAARNNAMAVTNNVEINVPAGTNLEQSESITDQVIDAIREGVWGVFRAIQYDNPQVE